MWVTNQGELAQVVERPIRIRKVPGSIPGFSILFCANNLCIFIVLSFD